MIANYHTHSRWCRHAVGEFTDYFQRAVELGFKEIAMTDHVSHKHSWCWLPWEDIEPFDRDLNRAIELYGDKIKIYKGFECEYLPEEMENYKYLKEELGYEFLIMGQHCDKTGQINSFNLTKPDELKAYGDSVCEGLLTGYFKLLAHPDVIFSKYPVMWDKTCEEVFGDVFELCEKLQIPVEINVNGFRDNRGYPNPELFKFSRKYDLIYMINTDAHDPAKLYDDKVAECEQWCRDLGLPITQLYPFDKALNGGKYKGTYQ
ncbi:MAG: PHP domain-containing protein [Lachnospiraceae bacterium]|nr:PHP domain-containing protein [Lachnospiraceae bacterium]